MVGRSEHCQDITGLEFQNRARTYVLDLALCCFTDYSIATHDT